MNRAGAGDLVLVAVIGVLWGLNWPAVKHLLGTVEPWTLRAVALALGALVLAILARAIGQSLGPSRAELPRLVLAGLLTVFGFNIMTAFGQLMTETSRAVIIAFTMPAWAFLFSVLFLGDRPTTARLAGIALGLAAIGILLAEDPAGVIAAPAGALFMLGAAISWAAGTVLLKAGAWTIGPIARSTWMVAVSAVPAAAGAALAGTPALLASLDAATLLVFAFHVLGPMVACHAAWVMLVANQPVAVATIGTLLIPVVGVFSSALLLGEPLGPWRLAALGLVLAAIAVSSLRLPRQGAGTPADPSARGRPEGHGPSADRPRRNS